MMNVPRRNVLFKLRLYFKKKKKKNLSFNILSYSYSYYFIINRSNEKSTTENPKGKHLVASRLISRFF